MNNDLIKRNPALNGGSIKAVDLLVNSMLPPELRNQGKPYNKKNLDDLLAQVAYSHPDQYSKVLKDLSDVGRNASYIQGETLKLNDLRPMVDKDTAMVQMDAEIAMAAKKAKTPEELEQAKLHIWSNYATSLEKSTSAAALAGDNNLGHSVMSGARGNALQLKAMVTTPGLYTDYKDRIIPLFVRHSFSEGLRPAEYLASSYGTRRSVIQTKAATAQFGDILKQWNAAAAHLIVTTHDCGTSNGVDMTLDDPDLAGRVVAKSYGDVKAGDVIDRRTLADLNKQKIKKIVVRSPMTCQAKSGICAHCMGHLPTGHFPKIGYGAGVTAASGVGEPLVQGSLQSKHTAGAFKGSKKQFTGYGVLSQLIQSPETFPHKAATAEVPGRVESIEDASQGGKYITVAGHRHYALPGYEPTVKPGDEVEAGDPMSEGITDVADVVRLRGLGEGRRYYVDRLKQALEESGGGRIGKLNLEVLARASLDHARIESPDGMGDLLPDDVTSYSNLSSNYSPPKDTQMTPVEHAHGKILQSPALHYSIGTKLTPKMASRIKDAGISHVAVSETEPAFVPEMVRLRAVTHNNPDWFARLHGSYLTANLQDSALRARDTDTESNVHFAPRLAKGEGFGKNLERTGKF